MSGPECLSLPHAPSKFLGETQLPTRMLLGGGAFGKRLGLDEVMRVEPLGMGLVASKSHKRARRPLSALHHVRTRPEVSGLQSGRGREQNQLALAPCLRLLAPGTARNQVHCLRSRPVCSTCYNSLNRLGQAPRVGPWPCTPEEGCPLLQKDGPHPPLLPALCDKLMVER